LGSKKIATGIVNGTEANGTEPWYGSVIALGSKNGDKYSVFCSGTLIDEKTIVTAAHCLEYWSDDTYVIFGLSESSRSTEGRKVVKHAYHENFQHPYSDDAKDVNDIGIAQFEGGLPAGFKPLPILSDESALQDGGEVILAGFGVTNGSTQSGAGSLRYTNVKIANAAYGKTEVQTDESKNGSCNGDSGGPGLVLMDGQYYVWGATSRGDARCTKVGVYTKVASHLAWINNKKSQWTAADVQTEQVAAGF
jgi:secreted trypsin-like serine protease